MAVYDGHCGIAHLLLQHQLCHGAAYDVRASEHHALLSARLDVVAAQQLKDAFRCGTDETGQADGHASDVYRMESVYVLAVVDGLDDPLFADVPGQWELHDETVHLLVLVQRIDACQEFLFRDVRLVAYEARLEAASLACQHLVADIGFGAAVVTYEDGCQVRAALALADHLFHFGLYFGLYNGCSSLSVNDLHRGYGGFIFILE